MMGAERQPHDGDSFVLRRMQGNVESLQTMLSDPESIAPALPLEMSFPVEQVRTPAIKPLRLLHAHARHPGQETA